MYLPGEAESAVGRRVRRSLSSAIGQGRACPQPLGEAEPALRHRARQSLAHGGRARWNQSSIIRTRNAVAFLSDRKCQRSIVISSTSLGTPVLGPRQYLCSYVSCILWHPILLIRRFLLSYSLIFTATLSLLFYACYSYSSLFLS